MILNGIVNIFQTLWEWLGNILDFIKSIPTLILDGIKGLFIPDFNVIKSDIESLKKYVASKFNVSVFDLKTVVSSESAVGDTSATIVYGNYSVKTKVLDSRFLVKAVDFFRPYIRAILTLMLVIFNVNQFLNFINQHSITSDGEDRRVLK